VTRRPGEWVTHSTIREVYASWWMTLRIDDVERPDGSHTEHEVVGGPDSAGMVVLHPERGILMIWRHRFIPDTWAWEIPGGAIDAGETDEEAARREAFEETGWEVSGEIHRMARYHPSIGLVSQTFSLFLARDAVRVGDPPDPNEAVEVAWRPVSDVARDVREGAITDGFSQLGIVLALAECGYGDLLRR
jgi:8-oxo-dGTP pyrophosphatase MutT (NUDIX family)